MITSDEEKEGQKIEVLAQDHRRTKRRGQGLEPCSLTPVCAQKPKA